MLAAAIKDVSAGAGGFVYAVSYKSLKPFA